MIYYLLADRGEYAESGVANEDEGDTDSTEFTPAPAADEGSQNHHLEKKR